MYIYFNLNRNIYVTIRFKIPCLRKENIYEKKKNFGLVYRRISQKEKETKERNKRKEAVAEYKNKDIN